METSHVQEFIPPEPSRLQAFAMKAAGLLLRTETPQDTLRSLVTGVGGYQENTDSQGRVSYAAEVSTVTTMSVSDETTASQPLGRYATGADHQDAIGADLSTAVARTVSRQRIEGPNAGSFRGKIARRLAGVAVKGVGSHPYTRTH